MSLLLNPPSFVIKPTLASAWRSLLLGIFATLLVAAAVGCGSDDSAPTLSNPDQTGAELTNRFITILADKDSAELEEFLSKAFILQRASGSFATKADYVGNIPDIGPFEITGVSAKQDDDSLVVKWSMVVQEVIDSQTYSGDPAPRLSTFVWRDGRWQLSSHANFNVPQP